MNRVKKIPPPLDPPTWQGNPALEPFLVPIADLHEDPANARRHPERNLAAIRASLARFCQQTPVVFDAAGVVRKGNGTLQAARALGWTHLAAVRSDLAGADLAGYAIADNRTSELAEWDDQALAAILEGLKAENGFPIEATGFDDAEVAALIGRLSEELPAGADGKEFDESIADEVEYITCPNCQHRWPK